MPYKVVILQSDEADEKTLNKLADEWDLVAVVPMLGKVDPMLDISATEYCSWPVAYLKQQAKRVV